MVAGIDSFVYSDIIQERTRQFASLSRSAVPKADDFALWNMRKCFHNIRSILH